MNSESKLKIISMFVGSRVWLKGKIISNDFVEKNTSEGVDYLLCLLGMPVSKISVFDDSCWDFNDDYPNSARNIKGTKLCIDFQKYDYIPKFVVVEVKVLFYCFLLNPAAFKHGVNKGRKKFKVNSVICVFEAGLRYINTIFKKLSDLYGCEYVESNYTSLKELLRSHYEKAAEIHRYVYDASLRRFLNLLKHPYTEKHIVDGRVKLLDPDSLNWLKKKETKVANSAGSNVLPNRDFEKLTVESSCMIVRFLDGVGVECSDVNALAFSRSNFTDGSNLFSLSSSDFDAYRVLRLKSKGYPDKYIRQFPCPENVIIKRLNDEVIASTAHIRKSGKLNMDFESVRIYLNKVYYACLYIIAVFTGMRPSELSDVIVKDSKCLVNEGGCWLIQSSVKKHRENLRGLFDDKWVAIPIVRDAIKAASHISTIKNNPYLASSMDTVLSFRA